MNFVLLSWMFALVVTIHNIEEAIFLPKWSRTAGRWHYPVGDREFRFAVAVITVLTYVAAYFATSGGKGSIGAYIISGYALAMLLNVLFPHLIATLAMRRYAPGTATALLFNLPITSLLLYQSFHQGYVEKSVYLYIGPSVAVGIVLLIPVLFAVGRRLFEHKKS
ncbi:MAG: HXXEE domain-containing protein [Deltaproteobacteria bacterium]|nr:HXXEE domain-containing protein [Deltaproteobacteria bacterium]